MVGFDLRRTLLCSPHITATLVGDDMLRVVFALQTFGMIVLSSVMVVTVL